MTYDTWKACDPTMEREGRVGDALDRLISALGDIWTAWGLEPIIDTPDLSKQEWIDQVYDHMLDDRSDEWIAEMVMEAWIEEKEGDHGPWVMDVKTYRDLEPSGRSAWRIAMLKVKFTEGRKS
jgi:hypothetical protein